MSRVRLLGQLDLSPGDVDKLANFIKRQIMPDVRQGTEFLKRRAPSCLACFLVWEGISNYREGDYWSVIRNATGLSPNWQSKWGQIFIGFLQSKGLPILEIPGARRYVAPILAHGGIPDYCLQDFFGRVLLPIVSNLADPADRKEILQEINIYRQEVWERNATEDQIGELRGYKGRFDRELRHLTNLIAVSEHLQRIKELEEEVGDIEEITGIPENPSGYISSRLEEMQRAQELLEDMSRISDVCISLRNSQDQMRTFAQQMADQVQETRQELGALTSSFRGQVDSVASIMQQEFAEDKERKKGSEDTLRVLIDQIDVTIEELLNQTQAQNRELLRLRDRLLVLGDGDFNTGVRRAEERIGTKQLMESLELKLQSEFPNLDSLEQELRQMEEQGVDIDALEFKRDQLESRRSRLIDRINELNTILEHYPAIFGNTNEPARRFLLYGGEIADDFLLSCVQMMNQMSNKEEISVEKLGLPKRVVKAFEEWWMSQQKSGETDTESAAIRSPDIVFDHARTELKVYIPAQYYPRSESSSNVCVELYIDESSNPVEKYRLNVYNHGENLFKTEETEIPLSIPAREYNIRLKAEKQLLREWPVPGISDDKPYMAFDYSSGKLTRSEELPGKMVFLIAHTAFSLYPSEIVMEDSRLYGEWNDYKYYVVDLGGHDNISLINAQSESHSVSISSGEPLIGLANGQTLKYISSQGNEVYVGKPPNIRIPLESEAELGLWRLSIHGTSLSEAKYCKLQELSDLIVHKQDGSGELILADERLLGSHGFGRFSIRLRGPDRVNERFVFCFLSHFDAMFDKHIYLPVRSEEIPKAILSVKTAESVEFEPEAPAELIDDNPCRMQVDLTEDFVKGYLLYNPANGSSCELPITINLPKVQWRIRGLTKWSIRTTGISSDDWEAAGELLLDIKVPEDIEGRMKLICGSQDDTQKIHDGKICFDMRRFSDTVRSKSVPSVFMITLLNSEAGIENIPLFRIPASWKVESVKCFEETEGLDRSLHISWSESGETDQKRIVRLWNLQDVNAEPSTEIVHIGLYEVVIQNPPPGMYRSQVSVEDPWNPVAVFPETPAPNTEDIAVNPRLGCRICGFLTFDRRQILEHLKKHHIKSFFRVLTYTEIRVELDLPVKIYKCGYCSFYCFGSYPNPTTEIDRHIEKFHKPHDGPARIIFRAIEDIDEIRENFLKNIPHAYKCNICGHRFDQHDEKAFMKHLIESHEHKLYSLE